MEGMSKLGNMQKRISYTAITRAKTALRFYWEGKLPSHLQQARAAFESGAAKVDLDKLFVEGDE
jgi:ATP-dependent exoDNAse (exonuclease V) alpha subunit